MENSNKVIEIKSRIILHPKDTESPSSETEKCKKGNISSISIGKDETQGIVDFINQECQIAEHESKKECSTAKVTLQNPCEGEDHVNKEKSPALNIKTEEGEGLVGFVQKHPFTLLGVNVMLCVTNLTLILICLYGLPEMPSLPQLSYETLGLATMESQCINPCALSTAVVTIVFSLSPFLLFCPKSPSYSTSTSRQLGSKSGVDQNELDEDICTSGSCENVDISKVKRNAYNKERGLVDFVSQHAKLVFWTSYALTFLNAVLVIICYCGMPNICEISPFNIVCAVFACLIDCARNASD